MAITSSKGMTVQITSSRVFPSIGSASLSSYFSARCLSSTQAITDTTAPNTKVPTPVSKLNSPSTSGAAVDACTGSQL